jgi:hypothetical protein
MLFGERPRPEFPPGFSLIVYRHLEQPPWRVLCSKVLLWAVALFSFSLLYSSIVGQPVVVVVL